MQFRGIDLIPSQYGDSIVDTDTCYFCLFNVMMIESFCDFGLQLVMMGVKHGKDFRQINMFFNSLSTIQNNLTA